MNSGVGMVRTLKEAMILSQLKERPRQSEELASAIGLGKSNISKTLREMKRLGLVRGGNAYSITNKGRDSFDDVCARISGRRF